MDQSSEEVDDAAVHLDFLEISDEDVHQTIYKQTGKRINRVNSGTLRSTRYRNGLEKNASTPEYSSNRHPKRRLSTRGVMNADEEENKRALTIKVMIRLRQHFWRASANAVEAVDQSEPTTFQEAINGPDQVHWRNAVEAELKSMRLREVL